MYKLKNVAARAAAFTGAVFMLGGVVATALPGVVSADALNPLTERTLKLTSSSPGFHYLDGSGNTTYAPPGSGPNGKQTGEDFSFRVSTNSSNAGTNPKNTPIKAFTFQYCTGAAGSCIAPGDTKLDGVVGANAAPRADTATHSDLNVIYGAPVCGTDFYIYTGELPGTQFDCTGWSMTTANKETVNAANTGKNNFITLSYAGGGTDLKPVNGTMIRIVFKASSTQYITNPGSGAFFVRINDFDSDTLTDPLVDTTHIIDGGVTVANVMTDSIQIQTKVLETMSFSVGTENPDLYDATDTTHGGSGGAEHGPCDAIRINKDIQMGESTAEFSLSPQTAFDAHSYWRLSSNSSGGATVYYSGATLSNTVGDQINAIGTTAKASHPGMEQFGLALDSTADTVFADMQAKIDADALLPSEDQQGYSLPHLTPLSPMTGYAGGTGTINGATPTATFAFDNNSLTTATPFANFTTDVIKCSTGKMRYLANIAPDTPAGVYTSKINYLAAPQY